MRLYDRFFDDVNLGESSKKAFNDRREVKFSLSYDEEELLGKFTEFEHSRSFYRSVELYDSDISVFPWTQ